MRKSKVSLLDCPIDNFTMEETVNIIERSISQRKVTQHVVVNAAKLVYMKRDKLLRDSVLSCDIISPDGQSVVWASRFLGYDLPERVSGIDLMSRLIEVSAKKGYKVYFLGAKRNVVQKVVSVLKNEYPSLNIVGFRDGYFNEEDEIEVAREVRDCRPDILFVGISSPKKEVFLGRYKDFMQVPFVMGVGGSFDVIAGVTKRAPVWMQRCGVEWLYRLIQEPRRMWKRYLVTNTLFIFYVLREKLRQIGTI